MRPLTPRQACCLGLAALLMVWVVDCAVSPPTSPDFREDNPIHPDPALWDHKPV